LDKLFTILANRPVLYRVVYTLCAQTLHVVHY
jgi:hypothetical protein